MNNATDLRSPWSPAPTPAAGREGGRRRGVGSWIRTALVLTLWPAAILLAAYVYIGLMPGLLGRFGEHWPLLVPIVVVGLILSGQLGAGYGLPSLFRDSPDRPSWDIGRSVLSGLGVGLLVLTVTISIYYGEFTGHFDRVVTNWEQWPDRWEQLNEGGASPSVWGLFWEPARRALAGEPYELIVGCDPDAFGGRPVFAGLSLPTIAAYVFQFWAALPIAVMLALCVLLPTPEVERRIRPNRTGMARWFSEKIGYLVGVILAIAVGYAFGRYVPLLAAGKGMAIGDLYQWRISRFSELVGANPTDLRVQVARNAVRSIGGYVVFFAIAFWLILRIPRISPGLGICLVFSLFCLAYLLVLTFASSWQFGIVAALAFGLICVNSGPFKYRFPGMDRYYDRPGARKPGGERGPKDLEAEEARIDRGEVPNVLDTILLSDRRTLDSWRARYSPGGGLKPRLVLVTTTGGAYRASFWTTTVLESLSGHCPRLLNHVRLITGASGGMVGASYVVACLRPPGGGGPYSPPLIEGGGDGMARGPTRCLEEETNRDSLAPIARQILRGDLFNALFPVRHRRDRGLVLDEQWRTLRIPFSDLREGEREGWRPSLVLSPMVVETGRRLLFSNLDLFGLTEARGQQRRDVSFLEGEDPGRLRGDRKALEGGGAIGPGRLYSRSAVEFFRAFPASYGTHHDGRTPDDDGAAPEPFTVATAVRMNATFPYISPATCLPVEPPRRVVDAGYYDNYGVDLAANWALQNRDWIREETSGIALIQIRASESEIDRKRLWIGPPRDEPTSPVARLLRRLTQGVYALSTPPKAAFSALGGSMAYRNDILVAELDEIFNATGVGDPAGEAPRDHPGRTHRFFETFVFENPIPFGMNWFVTGDEIRQMQHSMEGPRDGSTPPRQFHHNQGQKAAFLSWFGDGSGPGRPRRPGGTLAAVTPTEVGDSADPACPAPDPGPDGSSCDDV